MHRISTIGAAAVALAVSIHPTGVAQQTAPAADTVTIDALISLKRAQSPAISPDGRSVAFTVREANWDDNAYHT